MMNHTSTMSLTYYLNKGSYRDEELSEVPNLGTSLRNPKLGNKIGNFENRAFLDFYNHTFRTKST